MVQEGPDGHALLVLCTKFPISMSSGPQRQVLTTGNIRAKHAAFAKLVPHEHNIVTGNPIRRPNMKLLVS